MSKDVIVVAANVEGGQDRVIGDVHGSSEDLRALLEAMGPKDRLFIVGDLVDKGGDSIGVVELLSQAKYKDRVFAVRGNHEDLCLKALSSLGTLVGAVHSNSATWIGGLEKIIGKIERAASSRDAVKAILGRSFKEADANDQLLLQTVIDLRGHLVKNQGQWLVAQFLQELKSGAIQVKESKEGEKSLEFPGPTKSKVGMVKSYMDSLPYIIHKEGSNPFNIVHADMPMNDAELAALIKSGKGLSPAQKSYCMWAREDDPEVPMVLIKGRDGQSIVSVVGHNIVLGDVPAIRAGTNTVNIDLGAYSHGYFLVLNMTTGKAEYNKPTEDAHLLAVLTEVNKHLEIQFKRGLSTSFLSESKQEQKAQDQKQVEQRALTSVESVEKTPPDKKIIHKPGAPTTVVEPVADHALDSSVITSANLRAKG